jgi:putative mRNA 3-end processing factor
MASSIMASDLNGLKRSTLFDFSSHAGKEQLLNLGDSFSNASHIFTVHGEAEACESLATTLHKQYGKNTQVAENGQKITLTD